MMDSPANYSPTDLGAWILPIGHGMHVAVGRHELKYIEYIKSTFTLPGLPAYCEQGFLWRDNFIPALDIYSLVERRRMPAPAGEQMVAIIAYENSQDKIELGAILLQGVPKLLSIQSSCSVSVTELNLPWRQLAHAAFRERDELYPVLDLRCLFDNTPSDLLSLH